VNITITVDTREVQEELRRLMAAPGLKTVLEFNEIFAYITAEVMAIVHIETGSLKSTVKWDSPTYPGGWHGTIHAGGAAPGRIRDPAFYGVYELARGGSHFFFAPAYEAIPSKMINTILKFYSNSNREFLTAAAPSLTGAGKVAVKSSKESAVDRARRKTELLKERAKRRAARQFGGGL
jgi:hypothetical protein